MVKNINTLFPNIKFIRSPNQNTVIWYHITKACVFIAYTMNICVTGIRVWQRVLTHKKTPIIDKGKKPSNMLEHHGDHILSVWCTLETQEMELSSSYCSRWWAWFKPGEECLFVLLKEREREREWVKHSLW